MSNFPRLAFPMKVRAWDTVAKEMLYAEIEQFDDMLGFRFEHFQCDKPIYMWGTGQTDKNGKDLYEGDIIKIDDDWDAYGFASGFVGHIVYHEGSFRLTKGSDQKPRYIVDHAISEGGLSIGNIYEDTRS